MNLILLFLLQVTLASVASTLNYEVFYVSSDNSTNTSCPFQPCATFSQYLLDNNGSLPVLIYAEYHFLPGEHHVPTNMTLQGLFNVTILGSTLSPTKFIGDFQSYLKVVDSLYVTIKNVVFKRLNIHKILLHERHNFDLYNLAFIDCFSCAVINSTLLEYGFYGDNLMGRSYLSDILIDLITIPLCCYSGIHLIYTENFQTDYLRDCLVVLDRITITSSDDVISDFQYGTAIHIGLPYEVVDNITIIISNSYFYHMINRAVLYIYSDVCAVDTLIQIKNCIFKDNKYNGIVDTTTMSMVKVQISHYKVTLILSNCSFTENDLLSLLSVDVYERDLCWDSINLFCDFSSSILITNSSFLYNSWTLLQLLSGEPLTCVNVNITGPINIVGSNIHFFKGITKIMHIENFIMYMNGPINIIGNSADVIMSIHSSFIHFNGVIVISKNKVNTAIEFHSSSILFNGPITISRNTGSVI